MVNLLYKQSRFIVVNNNQREEGMPNLYCVSRRRFIGEVCVTVIARVVITKNFISFPYWGIKGFVDEMNDFRWKKNQRTSLKLVLLRDACYVCAEEYKSKT